MLKFKSLFALFLSMAMLSACASDSDKNQDLTDEQLYQKAHDYLERTSYARAAETFEKVELEYPYSKWATRAKLLGAYAYYKDQKYDDAIMSLERFIKFHPGNKDIAYAYYMKAICYYEQISDVKRDQRETELALDALKQVIYRFPDTEYAADAKGKINLAVDHLAGKEMEVGRYYLSQQNYLSALNRFSAVVTNYQTTGHIEEALYREVEVYKILGLNDEANQAAKVLNHNYPDSDWNKKAQKLVK